MAIGAHKRGLTRREIIYVCFHSQLIKTTNISVDTFISTEKYMIDA